MDLQDEFADIGAKRPITPEDISIKFSILIKAI